MNHFKKFARGIMVFVTVTAGTLPLYSQQQNDQEPKPAAREYPPLPGAAGNQQDMNDAQNTSNLQPDDRPLTGVQNAGLGTPEMRHSYFVPGLQYSNLIRSNSVNPSANTGWNSTSYVAGIASLSWASRHSMLAANYSGGGYFSTDDKQGNGTNQQLAFAYQLLWRRWQVLFQDEFSYLPESTFGFGGTTGLSIPGVSGSLGANQIGRAHV
jgi:hypothetical protein